MKITRISPISGIERTIDLPTTQEQIDAHTNGEYIQVAMKNLTAGQREFYMTGITDEEWDETFKEDDDSDEPDFDQEL